MLAKGEIYEIKDNTLKILFEKQTEVLKEKFSKQPKDRLHTYTYVLFDRRYFAVERALKSIVGSLEENTAIYHVAFCCFKMITSIFQALSNILGLRLDQIYAKNVRGDPSDSQLKSIEKALMELFKIRIKNIDDITNDEDKAKQAFELWCAKQPELRASTIQNPKVKDIIAMVIRDFAWSELISGDSLTPNWERGKKRLIEYQKSHYLE